VIEYVMARCTLSRDEFELKRTVGELAAVMASGNSAQRPRSSRALEMWRAKSRPMMTSDIVAADSRLITTTMTFPVDAKEPQSGNGKKWKQQRQRPETSKTPSGQDAKCAKEFDNAEWAQRSELGRSALRVGLANSV